MHELRVMSVFISALRSPNLQKSSFLEVSYSLPLYLNYHRTKLRQIYLRDPGMNTLGSNVTSVDFITRNACILCNSSLAARWGFLRLRRPVFLAGL